MMKVGTLSHLVDCTVYTAATAAASYKVKDGGKWDGARISQAAVCISDQDPVSV